jgi:hypothetical protein
LSGNTLKKILLATALSLIITPSFALPDNAAKRDFQACQDGSRLLPKASIYKGPKPLGSKPMKGFGGMASKHRYSHPLIKPMKGFGGVEHSNSHPLSRNPSWYSRSINKE